MSRPSTSSRPPRRRLASFALLRRIGRGGMGEIYLAHQPALDRLVVLKKIRQDLLGQPSMLARFQREARAAAAIHHQNVVAVYDCFEVRGHLYIAQEFVNGQDLGAILGKVRRIPAPVAALIALEIARGLEEIHAQGIVHRDLKPSNILMGCGGEVKIADFGIALEGGDRGLTRPGTVIGSVPYLSPEQLLGEPLDTRSDLFLLGVLLFEMLTGRPPYRESDATSVNTLLERMQQQRYPSPRDLDPGIPRYLARLIRACLRPRPRQRVPTATQIRRHLERHQRGLSPADCRQRIATFLWDRGALKPVVEPSAVHPGPRSMGPPRWRSAPRWRRGLAAAAVLLAAGVASSLSYRSWGPARDSMPAAAVTAAARPPDAAPAAEPPVAGPDVGVPAPPEAAVPPADPPPARVRFIADPWARVSISGAETFLTPRAEPLALPPGTYEVVFEHPRHGRASYTLDLTADEQRTVRHMFSETTGP